MASSRKAPPTFPLGVVPGVCHLEYVSVPDLLFLGAPSVLRRRFAFGLC